MTSALAQEILQRSGEHLLLVLVSVALALLIALPLGLAVQGRPRQQQLLLAGANTVQTIPSLALFGLLLTVPLLWNEVPDHENIVQHPHFKVFEKDLHEIQALCLPPGEIHTAILIKLPAGARIPTHRDAAPEFKMYRRIHLPIVTNPKCFFTGGSQTIHMKAGELWEIDNDTQLHSVVNGGSEDRVHLLIDYFVEGFTASSGSSFGQRNTASDEPTAQQ